MITWRWLLDQARPHRTRLIWANIVAITATLISVPIPLLMPLLVDEVLLDKPDWGLAVLNHVLPQAWQHAAFYIAAVLVIVVFMRATSQALNILQSRQFTLVGKAITYKIRQHLIAKLGRVSMQEYELRGSGGLTSHLVTDVETIDKFIGTTLSKFIIGILTVMGTAVVLLWLDWRLGLFILLINPIVVALSRALGQRVKHLKKRENQAFERFQQRLVDTLDGLYQLRAANREREYLHQLDQSAGDIKVSADKYAWQSEAAGRLSFLMFLIGFELFRAVAMGMVFFSDLTIGQMFAVFGYLWFMLGPVQELLGIQFAWYSAKAAMNRVNDVLSLQEEARRPDGQNPSDSDNTALDIEIEDLHFAYDEDKSVLNGLNMHIPAGQRVALVGASGGGKSTLIQLLLGLYPVERGDIRYNGYSINQLNLAALRQQIAVVLQQPMLFNDTLRNNLSLGRDVTDSELWHALEQAQLGDVVNKLTQGLDTPLGRQGIRLSGGQRQRVAIARMLLGDPKLVILDEATSALDTATERALHQAMHTFLAGRTTLIVAHRLSAVKEADLIYVLEDGQVTQKGTHGELVTAPGVYQTLYGTIQQAAGK
ncbi:ABC transporter ATP-binding protein [Salinivibrio proteolyticus]|uniref:ABC transporter ATP-binding protein n=1 Tax=Salinivibrio proteolyticus TaxID=334715 RepID=A0ABY7L8F5_9GAMM|nr:ABC transporter ATP-binding protein [Salinivibrio proteolyticus]WBA13549.1 ABC transporter ATP-binding protein [Salinivibrio proteolyticus]